MLMNIKYWLNQVSMNKSSNRYLMFITDARVLRPLSFVVVRGKSQPYCR